MEQYKKYRNKIELEKLFSKVFIMFEFRSLDIFFRRDIKRSKRRQTISAKIVDIPEKKHYPRDRILGIRRNRMDGKRYARVSCE